MHYPHTYSKSIAQVDGHLHLLHLCTHPHAQAHPPTHTHRQVRTHAHTQCLNFIYLQRPVRIFFCGPRNIFVFPKKIEILWKFEESCDEEKIAESYHLLLLPINLNEIVLILQSKK